MSSTQGGKHLFSFFPAPVSNTRPSFSLSPFALFRYLNSGLAAEATERIRAASTPEERRELKRMTLDFCTPGCVVSVRRLAGLISYSGLMVVDLDHIPVPDVWREVREWGVRYECSQLHNDPAAVLGFVSPSGDGYKLIIDVTDEMQAGTQLAAGQSLASDEERRRVAETYKALFSHWADVIGRLGYEVDKSGSDITRACYLPHDVQPRISHRFMPRVW